MSQIFISYRREDSFYVSRGIYDRLTAELGDGAVFFDTEKVEPGADFPGRIQHELDTCEVVLAVVGHGWLHASCTEGPRKGERRLDDPRDWVRVEIETALSRDNLLLLPVLVGQAKMPKPDELPSTIAEFAGRNAVAVRSGADFDVHLERLVRVLTRHLNQRADDELLAGAPPSSIESAGGISLRLVPAGEFQMGSAPSDDARQPDEVPQHPVRVTDPFYLGVCPITAGQYAEVNGRDEPLDNSDSACPAVHVTWTMAADFCNRLSLNEGLPPYYLWEENEIVVTGGGRGYRLPTEAEYEYACRAGTQTSWNCGASPTGLERVAWFADNSGGRAHPVGQKEPNAFGLHDMHGNVWQWCGDWYSTQYYQQSPRNNPLGPLHGQARVLRGGAFDLPAKYLRSAMRDWHRPWIRRPAIGFRIARDCRS